MARPKSANYMMNSAKDMFPTEPPKPLTRPTSPGGGIPQQQRTLKTATKAEAAVAVMKKLAEAAGEQVVVRGNSIFDSLGYLRTDPAVVVLKNKQWREFFMELQEEEQQQRGMTGRLNATAATDTSTAQPESPSKDKPDYPRLHRKLVRRVHHLWNDLRIPESDRDFYGYHLLKTRFESPHQLIDIAEYIRVLQAQRKVTMYTLKTISERERVLQQVLELLSSVQRRGVVKFADEERGNIWKSEFTLAVLSLQQHNIKVIQAIQHWRQSLCRPFPFMYV